MRAHPVLRSLRGRPLAVAGDRLPWPPLSFLSLPVRLMAAMLALWLGLVANAAAAAPAERVALVIGNARYEQAPLRNPKHDAQDLAALLRRAGFEVLERHDRGPDDLRRDLADFQDRIGPTTTALFYFAGHGVQGSRGQNFLLPVNVPYKRERDAELYGLEVGAVLRRMEEAGAALNLVILDACRDSPLPAEGRSLTGRGLGRMEAPSGSLIAFSTAPGQIADENVDGRNGLYTTHLLRQMATPGLRLEDVFKRVRRQVEAETRRRQSPEEISKLTADEPFYFFPPVPVQVAAPVSAPAPVQVAAPVSAPVSAPVVVPAIVPVPVPAAAPALSAAPTLALAAPTSVPPRPTPAEQNLGRFLQDCAQCPELVLLPAGQFLMGVNQPGGKGENDASPQRRVSVAPFLMGRTEVTQAQWRGVMGDNPSRQDDCDDCPVERVSWSEAQAYVATLSALTGRRYRLPTEAEWEYAARAGGTGRWSHGDDERMLAAHAWYAANSEGRPQPVGRWPANAFGLHDMQGNVWEWVQDAWVKDYRGAPVDARARESNDPEAPRVMRGGSWQDPLPGLLAVSFRFRAGPEERSANRGLRVVREP